MFQLSISWFVRCIRHIRGLGEEDTNWGKRTMAVPGLNLSRVKWKDHNDVQSFSARPQLRLQDFGYINVERNGGAVTTRCKKKGGGWATPENVPPELQAEFLRLRLVKTPVLAVNLISREVPKDTWETSATSATSRDPWGSSAGKRTNLAAEFGCVSTEDAIGSKAWINQLQKKCPYSTDRRFLNGDWLFRTSGLQAPEPMPDKRYLQVHEKRPMTQSRKPGPFNSQRSTNQLVKLIHQHMNDRSRNTKASSRIMDNKHPTRALMKADQGKKGYLTLELLKECLERNFDVVMDEEELERVIEAYPSDIPTDSGSTGFNYMAFVTRMHSMGQEHPLGGHAGSSWGYQQPMEQNKKYALGT